MDILISQYFNIKKCTKTKINVQLFSLWENYLLYFLVSCIIENNSFSYKYLIFITIIKYS